MQGPGLAKRQRPPSSVRTAAQILSAASNRTLTDASTLLEYERAYRNAARGVHPDKNHASDANQRFVEINNAIETVRKYFNSAQESQSTDRPKASTSQASQPAENAQEVELDQAVKNCDAQLVEELLSRGAIVTPGAATVRDRQGKTALHYADFYFGSTDYIDKLIEHGADVNARDNHGNTPLHDANTCKESIKVMNKLLAKGADINAQNNDGNTPLHLTSVLFIGTRSGSLKNTLDCAQVFKFLKDKGANDEIKNKNGLTPNILARKNFQSLAEQYRNDYRKIIDFLSFYDSLK